MAGYSNDNCNNRKYLEITDVESKSEDVEVFYFPDEGTQQSFTVDWGENNLNQEHDFCVLEHEAGEGVKVSVIETENTSPLSLLNPVLVFLKGRET